MIKERTLKKAHLSSKIGTHNGTFHCDEALACFMLQLTKRFEGSEIIRTRDPSELEKMDLLVDVGGVYDPTKLRFDHHQIGFTGTLDENHYTKLSSAGLIYKHFGKEIIQSRLNTDDHITNIIYYKTYKNFIEAIDGIDNGIDQYSKEISPKYLIKTDLSSRVSFLNPSWNDPNPNPQKRFEDAMKLVGKEFLDVIDHYSKFWLPARKIVEKAVAERFNVDPSGKIMVLEKSCPWKDHLSDLEEEFKFAPSIIYVIFQDYETWRVQCVPLKEGSFENRLSLPWKGMRDEELSNASGIPGCIFVHISGFIGGNKSKEGALLMAKKALEQQRQ